MPPVPLTSTSTGERPLYFDSLAELLTYDLQSAGQESYAAPPIPYEGAMIGQSDRGNHDRARVLVCHDYKGGYTEKEDERGYTFQWWHLIDVFIYFSHHRVTIPPPAYIRTAHRFNTKIFGTLIFEWDEGSRDLGNLDLSCADKLVELCMERGFEGWLVNVEVPLGQDGRGKREHAQRLVDWLRYFTEQVEQRVPGGEVLWYDAVTINGDLRWQSALNDHNAPFFSAASGIFTDYHWQPSSLAATVQYLESRFPNRHLSDIFIGIDIFGRGQFGGGGFDSSVALEAIGQAGGGKLSTALFAPGWTVEAEVLGHDLSSVAGYEKWLADERHLWEAARVSAWKVSTGRATPGRTSVGLASAGVERARKLTRGIEHVKQLANSLASRSPRRSLPPKLEYHAPLPPVEALSSFFASIPRPRPSSSFFTDFSTGSGHGFFHRGVDVYNNKGWTKVDHHYLPNTLSHSRTTLSKDAFSGTRSLSLPASFTTKLCAIALPIPAERLNLTLVVIYKGKDIIKPCIGNADAWKSVLLGTDNLPHGWRRTTVTVQLDSTDDCVSPSWAGVEGTAHSTLIDSMFLAPTTSSQSKSIHNVSREASTGWVRWEVEGEFVYFTVWEGSCFLGWTMAREFKLNVVDTGEINEVVVKGLAVDGIEVVAQVAT